MAKTKIAVLVSGGGTNLQALIDAQGSVLNSGEITLVVSNARGAYALERAKKAGIATETVLKKELGGQEAFDQYLEKLGICQSTFQDLSASSFLSVGILSGRPRLTYCSIVSRSSSSPSGTAPTRPESEILWMNSDAAVRSLNTSLRRTPSTTVLRP